MRRWTTRIVVSLLLGAIVNVAVAWGCAYTVRFSVPRSAGRSARSLEWFADEHAHGTRVWFLTDGSIEAARSLDVSDLPSWVDWPARYPRSEDESDFWGWMEFSDGLGWPCFTLKCAWHTESDYLAMATDGIAISHRRDTDLPGERERALPLRPIWPGFAINTVFYAAVLWLLFAGPFVLRRWRRIRRGLCPKCAYDLRGSKNASACPECGVRRNLVSP